MDGDGNKYSSIEIKYNESLSSRLEHLVGNKFCSDLSFIIEDTNEQIQAHKLIVALSSPVLHRIVFGNETFPPSNIIKVDGICKESFMQILLYIYTDRINLNEDNVFEILQKSNYFGLPGIESRCLEYLEQNLSISSVPWIYHQLFFSAPSKLLDKCLQYIRIQPLEFFASEYFDKISIDELKSIFELDAINCTEVDLFEAMVKLSRAHCTAAGLEMTGENLRKILDGAETLLRLESLTDTEFDKCLAIQKDFYSAAEVNRIRADIRGAVTVAAAKRKWHTYQDAFWCATNSDGDSPSSSFYTGSERIFIYRSCKEGNEPRVAGHVFLLFDYDGNDDDDDDDDDEDDDSISKAEVLCGSGYEWQKCVNGEIPRGSVPISLNHSEPVFIARGSYRQDVTIGPAYMNGTMKIRTTDSNYDTGDIREIYVELSEFEILVAKNVKNPYDGNEAPDDAIFIGYDENNHKTYLGRAWFSSDLLPTKIILKQQREAFVSYGADEIQVLEFDFVRMDPGTYNWRQGMNGDVPVNAVIAGCTVDGETLYFGRTMHNGNYIPGKVHPSHGVLYVPFRGQEINFQTYDVLVHANDSKTSV